MSKPVAVSRLTGNISFTSPALGIFCFLENLLARCYCRPLARYVNDLCRTGVFASAALDAVNDG
jgi:hypothetical protein